MEEDIATTFRKAYPSRVGKMRIDGRHRNGILSWPGSVRSSHSETWTSSPVPRLCAQPTTLFKNWQFASSPRCPWTWLVDEFLEPRQYQTKLTKCFLYIQPAKQPRRENGSLRHLGHAPWQPNMALFHKTHPERKHATKNHCLRHRDPSPRRTPLGWFRKWVGSRKTTFPAQRAHKTSALCVIAAHPFSFSFYLRPSASIVGQPSLSSPNKRTRAANRHSTGLFQKSGVCVITPPHPAAPQWVGSAKSHPLPKGRTRNRPFASSQLTRSLLRFIGVQPSLSSHHKTHPSRTQSSFYLPACFRNRVFASSRPSPRRTPMGWFRKNHIPCTKAHKKSALCIIAAHPFSFFVLSASIGVHRRPAKLFGASHDAPEFHSPRQSRIHPTNHFQKRRICVIESHDAADICPAAGHRLSIDKYQSKNGQFASPAFPTHYQSCLYKRQTEFCCLILCNSAIVERLQFTKACHICPIPL